MNFKKSIVIAIIFLLVAGFYYFYEIVGKPKREEKVKQETTVFVFDETRVKSLDLHRRLDGAPNETIPADLSFEKKENLWMMSKPMETKADQNVVVSLITSVVSAKKDEVVEDDPKDVKQYNLESPDFTLTISDGTKTETLELGSQTVDKQFFYARIKGQKPVFLTNAGFRSNLERFLTGYRDRTIFDFKFEDVEKVAAHSEDETYVFEKKDDKWIIAFPPFPRPNSSAVENMVKGIISFQVAEFFKDTEDNRRVQRLDKAENYVEFYLKGKKQPLVFRFSTPMRLEQFLYTMVEGKNELYGLNMSSYQLLQLKRENFMKKSLFIFNTSLLESISVELEGKKFEIRTEELPEDKKDSKEDIMAPKKYKWLMTSPEKKELDALKIGSILNNIRNMYVEAAYFEKDKKEESGISTPSMVITGKKKDGKNLFVLMVGAETKDKHSYYVKADNEDTVETVQKSAVVSLKSDLKTVLGIK